MANFAIWSMFFIFSSNYRINVLFSNSFILFSNIINSKNFGKIENCYNIKTVLKLILLKSNFRLLIFLKTFYWNYTFSFLIFIVRFGWSFSFGYRIIIFLRSFTRLRIRVSVRFRIWTRIYWLCRMILSKFLL